MIGQCLLNKNKNTTVAKKQNCTEIYIYIYALAVVAAVDDVVISSLRDPMDASFGCCCHVFVGFIMG